MDTILDMAKELGEALQQDERFVRVQLAQAAADADEELQKLIGEFNLQRLALQNEMQKEDKNEQTMDKMNSDIRELYAKIMANPSMAAYNEVRPALNTLVDKISRIIMLSAQGEDPYTADEEHEGCSGSCATCGGCH